MYSIPSYPYSANGLIDQVRSLTAALPGIVLQKPNAIFYVDVFDGSLTTDSWGNPIPNVESTQLQLTCKLIALYDKTLPLADENPGEAIYRTQMYGYLVYPQTHPYPFPKKMKTKFLYGNSWRDAFFYPANYLHSAIEEAINLHAAIGQKVEGVLEMVEGS
jgi:hypothetical protein